MTLKGWPLCSTVVPFRLQPLVKSHFSELAPGCEAGELIAVGEVQHMLAVEVGQAVAGAQVVGIVAVIEEAQGALLVGGVREGVRRAGLEAVAQPLVHMELRGVVLRDAGGAVVDGLR